MKYKGFFVKITPDTNLLRENKTAKSLPVMVLQLKSFRMNRKKLKSTFSLQRLILNCCKTVLKKRNSLPRITSTARKKSISGCLMNSSRNPNKICMWYLIFVRKNDILISERIGGAVYGYLFESE